MPNKIQNLLTAHAPLIAAAALVPFTLHFVSVAIHAGMVTVLLTDLVTPNQFQYYLSAYLGFLFGALYLAMTNNAGKPNYWHGAAVALPIPVLDALHNLLTNSLHGFYLAAYLAFVTGYPVLAALVMVSARLRRRAAHARNAAKPSLSTSVEIAKPLLQSTI